MIFIKRYRAAMLKEYVQDALQRQPGHLGALLNVMLHHGVSVSPVVIEQGWAELSSDNFYQDVLAREVFLKHALQIRTDWSARARGYNKLAWVNDDRLLSAMLSLATSRKPRRVLDVGTGSAKVLLGLKRALGKGDFWGVDSSAAMLEKITARDGLTLKIGSAENLEGIPRRYFDLVTARMVFHHIAQVDRAMQAIAQVLEPGGTLVVCEGVPPSMRSVKWYTEMFRYKEDRHTLTETDLVNMFVKNGYDDVHMRTVVMRRASLNNWLDNSGIPQQNIDIIKQMHFDAPAHIAEDYDMENVDGDCLMTWRFAIVAGTAPD
jgi:SAM-dependent methyltransferase